MAPGINSFISSRYQVLAVQPRCLSTHTESAASLDSASLLLRSTSGEGTCTARTRFVIPQLCAVLCHLHCRMVAYMAGLSRENDVHMYSVVELLGADKHQQMICIVLVGDPVR